MLYVKYLSIKKKEGGRRFNSWILFITKFPPGKKFREDTGIFPLGRCGRTYSSDSYAAAIKEFTLSRLINRNEAGRRQVETEICYWLCDFA